ncbi:MAG: hypothetical protein ACFFCS_27120 [Candidatus Hodarchaeota archaeon]
MYSRRRMGKDDKEITRDELEEALNRLEKMKQLLVQVGNLDARVTGILKPKLYDPKTGKKIRIPFEVKRTDRIVNGVDLGVPGFVYRCCSRRLSWIKKILKKYFN